MTINSNDRYDAAVVINWLRRCQEDEQVANMCYKCPFSGKRCISHLQGLAADLLEKFVAALQSNTNEAEIVVTWLKKCGTKDRTCKTCVGCPFDDGEHNCMDWMHTQAADLLEQFVAESKV